MSDAFDPYYIWLGIPPEEQPPHHYRLLGVTLFENNREVIEAAANRQMAYMQEVSAGDEHIDEAQKILGELSKARVCLLNSEKKQGYDAKLRASFDTLDHASESTDASAPSAPTIATPNPPGGDGPLMPPQFGKTGKQSESVTDTPQLGQTAKHSQQSSKTKKKKQSSSLIIGLPVSVLIVLLITGVMLFTSSQNAKKEAARQKEIPQNDAERGAQAEAEAKRKAKEETDRRLRQTERKPSESARRFIDEQQLIPSSNDPKTLEHRDHNAYRKKIEKTFPQDPKELKAQALEISNERDQLIRTYEELNQDTVLSGHLRSSGQRLTTSNEVEPLPDEVAAWNAFDKLVNEYKLEQNEGLAWQPSEDANALRQAEKNLTTPNLTKEKNRQISNGSQKLADNARQINSGHTKHAKTTPLYSCPCATPTRNRHSMAATRKKPVDIGCRNEGLDASVARGSQREDRGNEKKRPKQLPRNLGAN